MKCQSCDSPARLAVRVTRPKREDVRVTVYTDDRVAPSTASRYCRAHGMRVTAGLLEVLVDLDETGENK